MTGLWLVRERELLLFRVLLGLAAVRLSDLDLLAWAVVERPARLVLELGFRVLVDWGLEFRAVDGLAGFAVLRDWVVVGFFVELAVVAGLRLLELLADAEEAVRFRAGTMPATVALGFFAVEPDWLSGFRVEGAA